MAIAIMALAARGTLPLVHVDEGMNESINKMEL